MNDFDKAFYKIVGRKLRELRENSKLTLTELSNKVSVTPKTIQRYEMGERKIDPERLKSILSSMDVDSDTFMREVQIEQFPNEIEKFVTNSDDELLKTISADPRKLKLAIWIAGLDERGLDRIEKILDAVEFSPDL